MIQKYQAVLFDLPTVLLDSWTAWDETAGALPRKAPGAAPAVRRWTLL